MIKSADFVKQAESAKYTGISYDALDCQAFVEKVLSDAGEKGHNWRGSNHMWREALSEKREGITVDEVPPGAWLFTLKHDGGEKKRGYNDDEGNAKHVGIYLGEGKVRHSTSAGTHDVQYDKISSSRWTAWGLCKYIDYGSTSADKQAALDALKVIQQYILGGGICG